MNDWIHRLLIASVVLIFAILSAEVYAQKADSNQVICYVSQLKNPYAFLGMAGDHFELSDGTAWRVTGNAYSYTPSSSASVLVCPEIQKMFISNAAITIEKSAKRTW